MQPINVIFIERDLSDLADLLSELGSELEHMALIVDMDEGHQIGEWDEAYLEAKSILRSLDQCSHRLNAEIKDLVNS